jgi:hypothetical protein
MMWNGMVKDTNPMDIYKQSKKGNLCDNFWVPWLFIDHQLSYINLQSSTSQNWEHHTYLTWVDNKAPLMLVSSFFHYKDQKILEWRLE